MNQLRMSRGSSGKRSAFYGVTETVVWNRCSYQVLEMVGTNTYTKKKITSFTTQRFSTFQEEE